MIRSMKHRLTTIVGIALGVAGVAAWQAPERVDSAAVAKIRDEGLNRSQVGASFNMLVDTIGNGEFVRTWVMNSSSGSARAVSRSATSRRPVFHVVISVKITTPMNSGSQPP